MHFSGPTSEIPIKMSKFLLFHKFLKLDFILFRGTKAQTFGN